jgi:hypothetical protein
VSAYGKVRRDSRGRNSFCSHKNVQKSMAVIVHLHVTVTKTALHFIKLFNRQVHKHRTG